MNLQEEAKRSVNEWISKAVAAAQQPDAVRILVPSGGRSRLAAAIAGAALSFGASAQQPFEKGFDQGLSAAHEFEQGQRGLEQLQYGIREGRTADVLYGAERMLGSLFRAKRQFDELSGGRSPAAGQGGEPSSSANEAADRKRNSGASAPSRDIRELFPDPPSTGP